jgi:hypothetical protein
MVLTAARPPADQPCAGAGLCGANRKLSPVGRAPLCLGPPPVRPTFYKHDAPIIELDRIRVASRQLSEKITELLLCLVSFRDLALQ